MQIQPVSLYHRQPKFSSKMRKQNQPVSNSYAKNVQNAYPRRYLPQYYRSKNSCKTYDSFTNLRDKNYLFLTLEEKIKESQETKKGFSLAMFDMDNFKSINELLGYKAGDDFIKEIANSISKVVKKNNLHAYRFGGDEFVVILDDKTPEETKQIAYDVTKSISNNEYIKSNQDIYIKNAYEKLSEYTKSSDKVKNLLPLKAEKELLENLQKNLTTDEARNDPYLKQTINAISSRVKFLYISLLTESIAKEEDESTRIWLLNMRHCFENYEGVSNKDEKELDEYLLSLFGKNYEIHQIKKWISDFNKNSGFNITGGIVDFTPEDLKEKTPIDIINITGEILKGRKKSHKTKNHLN